MTTHNAVRDEPERTSLAKFQQIRDAYAAEEKAAEKATKLEDIPFSYELITEEWLTAVLGRGVDGARVTGFQLGDADNGTANRMRIHSIEWNDAGQKAKLPSSVFCKSTMGLNNRLQLSFGGSHAEVDFFNHLRSKVSFLAPEAYWANMSDETYNSIIVLKDLTGTDVVWHNYKTDVTKQMFFDALDTLAQMHGQFWESQDPHFKKFVHWAAGFRDYVATCNLAEACRIGRAASTEYVPQEIIDRDAEIWPATVKAYQRNGQLPETYSHNDVHIDDNWFTLNGKLGAQDYQCSGRGFYGRDLAYCFGTHPTVENRRKWEDEGLEHYLRQLVKYGGPKIDKKEAAFEMDVQLFVAYAYWVSTLTPDSDTMPDMQPPLACYEMIKRMSHMMNDRKVFDAVAKVSEDGQLL